MALPDDVPGGADAAMLVLRFCYDFDAVAEAVAVGGCGLPALAVAADFFGCDTLNRLASEAFAAELEVTGEDDPAWKVWDAAHALEQAVRVLHAMLPVPKESAVPNSAQHSAQLIFAREVAVPN